MENIASLVSTVGFPIVACIGLGFFVKYMIDENNKNIHALLEMYGKRDDENREAIKACTEAINKLCDKMDDIAR